MNISETDIQRARSVSIYDILGIKNNGRRTTVRCVFHKDNTPSLCVYPNGGYHCFGCGKNGQNAIDFCQDLGLTFKEAMDQLTSYF